MWKVGSLVVAVAGTVGSTAVQQRVALEAELEADVVAGRGKKGFCHSRRKE